MADVAMLNLLEPDQIDYDNYSDGPSGKSYAPPEEGKYTGQLPIIGDENFLKADGTPLTTVAGNRKVKIDEIKVLGTDYTIKFTELSFKKYSNREGSQALDLLRACGYAGRPQTNEEIIGALKMMSGRTFDFFLQWKGWNAATQQETVGMEKFPLDEGGKPQPWFSSVEGDPDSKRVFANGKIKYCISAVKKTS